MSTPSLAAPGPSRTVSSFDLVDVRLVVDIADTNSLTRGAERSCISPPSASLRIRNIEDRLHTKLFYRSNRGVTLTPAGQAFLHHGRLILLQAAQLEDNLSEYSRGIRGHIRILANTTAIAEFLPRLLSSFLAAHPDVSVDLSEQLSLDIVRAVADGTAEIGIISDTIRTEGVRVLPYREDRLLLVVPRGHALSGTKRIKFADTLRFSHVGLVEASAIFGFLKQAADLLNKTITTRIRVGNFDALCRMVEAGVGVGILPESAARRYSQHADIRVIPLSDEWATRRLQICVRSLEALPALAKGLVDALLADANTRHTEPSPARLTLTHDRGRRGSP